MSATVQCSACGAVVDRHCSYVARIDLFADPASEPIDTAAATLAATDDALAAVLAELQKMSVDEMMDDVHRRFEFQLCRECHRAMLGNPLGLPRSPARTWDGPN